MAGGFSVEFGTEFVDFLLGEIAVLADDLVEFFFNSRLNGKKGQRSIVIIRKMHAISGDLHRIKANDKRQG